MSLCVLQTTISNYLVYDFLTHTLSLCLSILNIHAYTILPGRKRKARLSVQVHQPPPRPIVPLHRPPPQQAAADAAMPRLGENVGRITPWALRRPRRVYALEHTFSEMLAAIRIRLCMWRARTVNPRNERCCFRPMAVSIIDF